MRFRNIALALVVAATTIISTAIGYVYYRIETMPTKPVAAAYILVAPDEADLFAQTMKLFAESNDLKIKHSVFPMERPQHGIDIWDWHSVIMADNIYRPDRFFLTAHPRHAGSKAAERTKNEWHNLKNILLENGFQILNANDEEGDANP